MNSSTKNDLSANEVRLDYQALLTTSSIATGESLEQISGLVGKIRQALLAGDVTAIYLGAQWLLEQALGLAVAADTYAALLAGKNREIKTLVV